MTVQVHSPEYHFLFWLAKLVTKATLIGIAGSALYWFFGRMSERAKNFWIGIFSSDGTPSFSRVCTALIVVASIAWISYIVWFTRAIPDVGGVVLLIGTLYGLNVATNPKLAAAIKGNGSTPPAVTPPAGTS